MGIIGWVVLGLLAGAIAKAIYPGSQGGGFLSTMLLGIVGAFVGGSLHSFLVTGSFQLASAGLTLSGILIAVLGSILAIFIWQALNRRSI